MSTAIITNGVDRPLTWNQRQELSGAKQGVKKIRNAARVASFNGWSIGITAAMNAPFALFSTTSLLITLGLAVVSFNEFRGRRQLLRFDPSAAKALGWNQLALMTMVVSYCAWMLYVGLFGAGTFAAQMQAQPELHAALGSVDEMGALYDSLIVIFYSSVIVGTVVFQGLNSLYYFSRSKHVLAYVRDTPEWVREVQCD